MSTLKGKMSRISFIFIYLLFVFTMSSFLNSVGDFLDNLDDKVGNRSVDGGLGLSEDSRSGKGSAQEVQEGGGEEEQGAVKPATQRGKKNGSAGSRTPPPSVGGCCEGCRSKDSVIGKLTAEVGGLDASMLDLKAELRDVARDRDRWKDQGESRLTSLEAKFTRR